MKQLELLVPPPFVMLTTMLIMWMLSEIFPALTQAWLNSVVAAAIFGLLGLAISLVGVITFRRARTTVDPKHPAKASSLVSDGVYRYSRNPMYIGVLLVLIGWAAYLGNMLTVLCILGFIAYITRFQIIPEERLLQEKFGAEYTAYQGRTRRWL